MTVKDIIEFYFSQYETINVMIELLGGLRGKYHLFSKDEYYNLFSNWNNEKPISVSFSTYYIFKGEEARKLEYPQLNIIL